MMFRSIALEESLALSAGWPIHLQEKPSSGEDDPGTCEERLRASSRRRSNFSISRRTPSSSPLNPLKDKPLHRKLGQAATDSHAQVKAEMANLFLNQAKQYAATRPAYPMELFQFIASKTPRHDLAWDVGTGSGQAAASLAKLYKNVVGTDTSAQQLSYAPRLPNVRYVHTPPDLPVADINAAVAPPGSVDVVTVAQAFHWLDLPHFYTQVRSVLRAQGVLAAWCYTEPRVGAAVDEVFWRLYRASQPHWAPNRKMVDDEYRSVDFPFDPVDGEDHTGPFEFSTDRKMDLDDYLTYITSWSAYQTAKEKGVEMLDEDTVKEFAAAWGGDRQEVKTVSYPIFLRIGKVRPESENA